MVDRYNDVPFDPSHEAATFSPSESVRQALAAAVVGSVVQDPQLLFTSKYDPKSFEPASGNLDQHILLDTDILRQMGELIPTGARAVEIGAGPGVLTAELLSRGAKVTAFEIDERCAPMLSHLAEQTEDLEVKWQDFLATSNETLEADGPFHIVGNIPFGISEPLLRKMQDLDFESAVLLVGKRLQKNMVAGNPDQSTWNRLTLITRAYYNVEDVAHVPRDAFDPPPRVDAGVVRITRKDADPGWRSDAVTRSFRAIVDAQSTNTTLAKALKSVVVRPNGDAETGSGQHSQSRRNERHVGRAALRQLTSDYNAGYKHPEGRDVKVSETMLSIVSQTVDMRILNKPLQGLSNNDLAKVCSAISSAVNKRKGRSV